ncbi:hypothetical protein GGC63_003748 [Paenibacillus sp. OAS669]|nr:hypothetical protein [Paenibacillus sp. OAS669]
MAGPFLVLLVVCQDPRKGSAEGCKGHKKSPLAEQEELIREP